MLKDQVEHCVFQKFRAYTLLGRLRGGPRGAKIRGSVGFARLRGGFAKTFHRFWQNRARNATVLFRSSSCRLPIIFRQSDCNFSGSLVIPSGRHLKITLSINLWHATAMKTNTLQPRSGFAKWLRLCQCCRLRGAPRQCITQVASRTFWEIPTKLKSIM